MFGCGTFPVAKKGRNELDLQDMSGNVWEWCLDLYASARRLRGGGWLSAADLSAVSYRHNSTPDARFSSGGLRLARSL
jgi:formylglycine-generating enzyme required for sulfatase activity